MKIKFESRNAEPAPQGDGKPTQFFDDVITALKALAPSGARVYPIGFDNADIFLREGYRVAETDCDVVIARGGEREFGLARGGYGDGCKILLSPTHAHYASAVGAYRTLDGTFAHTVACTPPNAVVFDADDVDRNLASIFAEIAVLDLCAFDYVFAARLQGRRPDLNAAAEIGKLVANLTSTLRPIAKDRQLVGKTLVRAGRRAAELVAARPELLHCSGASQVTEALRMLCLAEDRSLGMRGETEMLLAVYVADFYIKWLTTENGFDFPPDNNRRIDSLCEYFGADLRRACIHASPIFPPLRMRLYEYRRDEFRTEFTRMLTAVKQRQNAAWQVFKRLYPDDGYGLKTMIDKTDLPICLALAPDVFAADSMLSFIKQTGRLERYIV